MIVGIGFFFAAVSPAGMASLLAGKKPAAIKDGIRKSRDFILDPA